MCDNSELGVLYTEHSGLIASTPVASLWSYETRRRGRNRRVIAANPDGSYEYWLERSDPLLNTILPGTGVSLIVNFGDLWAAGRSLVTSEFLPCVCVIGPVTQARILHVGTFVNAVGAVVPPTLASGILGVPAADLVDRIVPLQDLWRGDDAASLLALIGELEIRPCLLALRDALVARHRERHSDRIGDTASRLIHLRAGRVSIERMARSDGLSRQVFARRFCAAAGLPPKLFARITRFQALIHVLLSTDVSRWASVPAVAGFYDQAHMINEFRAFAGSPPTVFFRPHGGTVDPAHVQLRGRPNEWLQRPEAAATDAVRG
jgi:methylphosphotriester-DNA--protein-cysteine methyltransferase